MTILNQNSIKGVVACIKQQVITLLERNNHTVVSKVDEAEEEE